MKPIYRSNGSYMSRVISSGPIVYFPLNEKSGTVAKNWGSLGLAADGSYTGVDLAAVAGPKGGGAPYFDGANDVVNIYSAALALAFNGSAGTLMGWFKVFDASVWSDSTYRILILLKSDASNWVDIDKGTLANRGYVVHKGSGTAIVPPVVVSTTAWFNIAFTWDYPNDKVIAYLNGVQEGSPVSGLGAYSGALDSRWCCIGAGASTPSAVWNGYITHAAVWNRVLTPTEISLLGQ